MTTAMTVNGVSTCKAGEERYEKFVAGAFRGTEYYQYDYRHPDGELFSTVKKSLEECRRARDEYFGEPQQPAADATE